MTEAETVLGFRLKSTLTWARSIVNGAQVIITDVKASNGVIHVIDSVLLPADDIVDTAVN